MEALRLKCEKVNIYEFKIYTNKNFCLLFIYI